MSLQDKRLCSLWVYDFTDTQTVISFHLYGLIILFIGWGFNVSIVYLNEICNIIDLANWYMQKIKSKK